MKRRSMVSAMGLSAIGLLALAATPSAARKSPQDLVPAAPPQSRPIVLTNAKLHTVVNGVIEGGTLVFENGRITDLRSGAPLDVPAGAERIDLGGRSVYPGWVCFGTVMGLAEVGAVDMTLDIDEAGSFTPEVFAAVAMNPDSWVIPVTRRNGVLTCGVMPSGGRIPGRASVARMDGWTWEDLAIVRDAGLVVNWPRVPASPGEDKEADERSAADLAQLGEFFDAAQAYLTARAADPSVDPDLRLDAMESALSGDQPLFVNANGLNQIESAVRWCAERDLPLVIVGGRDAGLCAELLARHDVAVAITAAHRMPHRRDLSFASTYELPAILERAGVRWCMTFSASSWTTANARNLPYEAAACMRYGLTRAAALHSVTLGPAQMLGVGGELGSLEVGKRATIFVAAGDPFEITTSVDMAFVDGRQIVLEDKQTALDAKYREKYRQLGLLAR